MASIPQASISAPGGGSDPPPPSDSKKNTDLNPPDSQKKKEPTGAEKKAAAKAEKAARRAAQKGDGGSTAAADGAHVHAQPAKQEQKTQQQHYHHQRKQSTTTRPAQQQLPTRNRRPSNTPANVAASKPKQQKTKQLPFLSHLYASRRRSTPAQLQHPSSHRDIHPSVQTLALHLESYKICGSQARTISLLLALKAVIRNYTTPQGTSLPRHLSSQGLSAQLNHVKSHGRPFCTAQSNAVRWLKNRIATLDPSLPEASAVNDILSAIDEFIRERFTIADKVIAQAVAGLQISDERQQSTRGSSQDGLLEDGDDVLVFGKSAVVCASLREAALQGKRFAVVCVDAGRPLWEGRTMSRTLSTLKVPADQVDVTPQSDTSASGAPAKADREKRPGGITSLAYVPLSQLHAHLLQSPVAKVLLGANSVYSNGSVLSRAGQALAALAVRTECPGASVYVVTESIKCAERAVLGTNSLAVAELAPENELIPSEFEVKQTRNEGAKDEGGPSAEKGQDNSVNHAVGRTLSAWEDQENLSIMNSLHDITPPELIHAIVTEAGTVPPGTAAAVGRMVGVGGELGEV